ncbi:Cell wall surface anchor family protein FPXTG motif [Lactococcus lactis subsp. lactis]|nr:Cell wall surface anchor family protein FPXTG motif [Lactococcus lactis subsp. lactis]
MVKKSSIGLFPNFGETSQWIITTPNMDELKEHEEDNNMKLMVEIYLKPQMNQY